MSARILIIEDDEAILKFLRRGLAYEGYQVDTAIDGHAGLAIARDNPPDLVVLDLMLPGGLPPLARRRPCADLDPDRQGYR
jgi:two-component system response regulator MprA